MTTTIGGIASDAPLFMKTPELTLFGIVERLSTASYHYADDSASEWGRASLAKMEAAALINQHRLGFTAIEALYRQSPQIFPLGDLIDAILKDARK